MPLNQPSSSSDFEIDSLGILPHPTPPVATPPAPPQPPPVPPPLAVPPEPPRQPLAMVPPEPPPAPIHEREEQPKHWSQHVVDWLFSCLTSMTVHVLIIALLGLLVAVVKDRPRSVLEVTVDTGADDLDAPGQTVKLESVDPVAALGGSPDEIELPAGPFSEELKSQLVTGDPTAGDELGPLTQGPASLAIAAPRIEGRLVGPRGNIAEPSNVGGGLSGRSTANRGRLALSKGGTPETEAAVELGLYWLMRHQRPDGSWSFDQEDICQGDCRHQGTFPSRNAATGLALLPFLGAGYTHRTGPYRTVVEKGLRYLKRSMLRGGDLHEGSMYSQGVATIALCEALAMTDDSELRPLAQEAIDFIVAGQARDGGWRYSPKEPGDTTVTGWNLMALKSGKLAGLDVPSTAFSGAVEFLDSVASQGGAVYGYQSREDRPVNLRKPQGRMATTAIGLLGRIYTGWKDTRPGLVRGVALLERRGPDPLDMYFDYNATQVMHHYGGSSWVNWNKKMREMLVRTQAMEGHERGSWFLPHDAARAGGRLYCTCMGVMTLEVYYRYMPIYSEKAASSF